MRKIRFCHFWCIDSFSSVVYPIKSIRKSPCILVIAIQGDYSLRKINQIYWTLEINLSIKNYHNYDIINIIIFCSWKREGVSPMKQRCSKQDLLINGSISKALIWFALPLLGSSFIQLLYNYVNFHSKYNFIWQSYDNLNFSYDWQYKKTSYCQLKINSSLFLYISLAHILILKHFVVLVDCLYRLYSL